MADHTTIAILEIFITALAAIGASSGFWIFLDRKRNNRTLTTKLLLGLAHDRIVCLALQYMEKGYITQDEHENLVQFLYEPYRELGGNGSAVRLINEIDKLPISNTLSWKKGEFDDRKES